MTNMTVGFITKALAETKSSYGWSWKSRAGSIHSFPYDCRCINSSLQVLVVSLSADALIRVSRINGFVLAIREKT